MTVWRENFQTDKSVLKLRNNYTFTQIRLSRRSNRILYQGRSKFNETSEALRVSKNVFKNSVSNSDESESVFITEVDWLILF